MSCQYCGGDRCGSSLGGPTMCEERAAAAADDLNYSRLAPPVPQMSTVKLTRAEPDDPWDEVREPFDKAALELLWRTRIETTLNHFRGMNRDMQNEEDAARGENQKAYFAGSARAWELAAEHIENLLRL